MTTAAAGMAAATSIGPAQAAPAANPLTACPSTAEACFVADTTSGSFTIGSLTMPLTGTIHLAGALNPIPEDPINNSLDDATLTAPALQVPGGLLGVPAVQRLVPGVTDVTATTQLAGTPTINLVNVLTGQGTSVVLPLKIKLGNVLLGPNCTIGSDAHPILLNLTAGTTAPPAPNKPISGKVGDISFDPDTNAVHTTGSSLVDNSFSVPEASGCSPLGLSLLDQTVSGVVNAKQGLPSPAGKNTAILNSESWLGPGAGGS